jgi:cell division protein FtsL
VKALFATAMLLVSIVMTALQLVLVRHETRQRFVQLQGLAATRDRYNEEWGRLLLEQATWGTHARVEQIARNQLGMTVPAPAKIKQIGL